MSVIENLISQAPLLIVFGGMAALLWKALHALDVQNQALAQALARSVTPSQAPSIPVPSAPAPQQTLILDQAFVNAVKKFEGFAPKAKWDYKQYTNGYGTKATSADEEITEAEAERRLIAELGNALNAVKAFIPSNTPVGVEQALIDASFNLGTSWMQAGLGQAVKAGDWASAKEHLLQYNHAGGQVLDGLTKRRQAEVGWFDNPL